MQQIQGRIPFGASLWRQVGWWQIDQKWLPLSAKRRAEQAVLDDRAVGWYPPVGSERWQAVQTDIGSKREQVNGATGKHQQEHHQQRCYPGPKQRGCLRSMLFRCARPSRSSAVIGVSN